MKIAVTGALGLVGRAVCALAQAQGHEIVALSRRTGVDVADREALTNALAGCDAVIHAAGINREIGHQTYARVHVEAAHNVVAAARANGVRRIVLVSFLRARPNCGSPYHESKWAAEEIVRASGIDHTIVKLGVTYGPGDHLLSHLVWTVRHLPVMLTVGADRPLDVDDAARVLVAATADPRLANQTVALVGPDALPLAQIVRRVGAAAGRTPLLAPAPVWFHALFARGLELVMRTPLVARAQVRILAEGLTEHWGDVAPLPADLAATRRFTFEHVRTRLPADRSAREEFGCRWCRA